jgi:hypothetical protein
MPNNAEEISFEDNELVKRVFEDRQRDIILKVKVYLSAKMGKQEILKRLEENNLSPQEKKMVCDMIEEYYFVEQEKLNKFLIKGFLALLFVFFVLGVFYYVFFLYNSTYFSSKCSNVGEFSIDGDIMQRSYVVNALKIIEYDCDYLKFVNSFVPNLIVRNISLFEGGFYEKDSRTAVLDIKKFSYYGLAGVIVHEACHGYQDAFGLDFSESECVSTQYNFLESINASDSELIYVRNIASFNPKYSFGKKDVFAEWKSKQK